MIGVNPNSAFPALTEFSLLWLVATLAAFQLGVWLNRRCGGIAVVNPVLIAMAVLIAALLISGTDYATYMSGGGSVVGAVLGPATVALAVPLYNNLHHLRRAALPIVAGVLAGGMTAVVSAVGLALWLGGSAEIAKTLAVKSVTAPIAIGVADQIGGLASLAAAFAVLTGVAGTVLSIAVLDRVGIKSWKVRGLATGVTAHGQGTARILSLNETGGAFASLGMGLNALFTALWLPAVVALLVL
jgi:predicted murein hydrolase (TIGR00659 family)